MKFRIKALIFISCCFSSNLYCMSLPLYDRSVGMPQWERDRLTALAVQYDGRGSSIAQRLNVGVRGKFGSGVEDFVNRFIKCSRGGAIEYPTGVRGDPMRGILEDVAKNTIGRETMYRIMAKLEPRIECIKSIDRVLGELNKRATPLQEKLNILYNFLGKIGLVGGDFGQILINLREGKLDDRMKQIFDGFIDMPRSDFLYRLDRKDTVKLRVTIEDKDVEKVKNMLLALANGLSSAIYKMRFQLVFNPEEENYYSTSSNIISINGQDEKGNLVKGPIWKCEYGATDVETKHGTLTAKSSLKHEIGHYLRMGLLGSFEMPSDLTVVAPQLFAKGIDCDYLDKLDYIWTDADELNEIFGICVVGEQLLYDHLNQSEFNIEGGSYARYSHTADRITSVPLRLFNIFRRKGGQLPISKSKSYEVYHARYI